MMTGVCRVLGVVAVGLLLTACASDQGNRFYTLQPLAEQQPASATASIGMAPVKVPGWMDRSNLVWSDGGFRLHQKAMERWAEPLEDALTRITSQNLSRLFSNEQVVTGPWLKSESPDLEVRVEILGLADTGSLLELDARWEIVANSRTHSGEKLRKARSEKFIRPLPANAGSEQFVEGFSQLMVKLAEDIRVDIKQLGQ